MEKLLGERAPVRVFPERISQGEGASLNVHSDIPRPGPSWKKKGKEEVGEHG